MRGAVIGLLVSIVMVLSVMSAVPEEAKGDTTYPEGLEHYWAFDEGTGGVAYDSAGGKDGAIYGAAWTEGMAGGALYFDGGDLIVLDPTGMPTGPSTPFSISLWIRPDEGARLGDVIYWGSNPSASGIVTLVYASPPQMGNPNHGTLNLGYYANDLWGYAGTLNGGWHHVAATYDGFNRDIYLDGAHLAHDTTSSLNAVLSEFFIGYREHGFAGCIDEIAIFSRAITPPEVVDYYNNGLEGSGYGETSAQGELQDAVSALEGVDTSGLEDADKIQKKLDKAVEHLMKSLNIDPKDPEGAWKDNGIWADEDTLDPKEGKHAFKEWAKTAKELNKLIEEDAKGKISVPDAVLELSEDVIGMLVDMAKSFAIEAFEMAEAIGGDEPWENQGEDIGGDEPWENELEKSAKEFEKAQDELDHVDKAGEPDPKYDKAIEHYMKAWEHAQKAIKHLTGE